ncbi:hypothetical protein MKU65_02915 [Leptospira interrogans]|uniref:Uncharacterized protein n=2 Tax=Leptospira TaxID=171 RepID=A0AAQ1SMU2_LEPIR|nr:MULTISPECIES: hypothetical protein [Leptospira]EMN69928.1 hypothetical protein LEP1GSC100_1481 [Leptospira interrogans serovar Bataviae str. UI 08561]AKP28247.1 hypothetical protein LIMLP_19545 [Leptospira interrogans serovar Manilae]AKP32029.1 hypothetical protein LIMHP_19550 [Leptospira interrogans serovar Manilae]EKO97542.1 hypothetical protein LEP1GSC057_4579 [Leptospira interrogans str. Brem 329]EYU64920.1 hypothetical protein CI00_00135 [Leptospira interrogans serovar Manilae]
MKNPDHTPYSETRGFKPDFRVKYRFLTEKEGGRKTIPYQAYRSDFAYENFKPNNGDIYMIWPEFLDSSGKVIRDRNNSVEISGQAYMWILVPEMRKFHRERIQIGTKGFAMEGNRKTAEYEVIEIIGLLENPDSDAKR